MVAWLWYLRWSLTRYLRGDFQCSVIMLLLKQIICSFLIAVALTTFPCNWWWTYTETFRVSNLLTVWFTRSWYPVHISPTEMISTIPFTRSFGKEARGIVVLTGWRQRQMKIIKKRKSRIRFDNALQASLWSL